MVDARLVLRNRILGLLLRSKREQTHKSKQECAAALGVPVSTITAYEDGLKGISLPELEALAYALGVAVSELWSQAPEPAAKREQPLPLQAIIELRQRIVGALLGQARNEAGLSQKQVAAWLEHPVSRIAAYEQGRRPIPFAELELLAPKLGKPVEYFLGDGSGPLAKWHLQMANWQRFQQLPPEMQEFALLPANVRYLEVAMKLAHIPADGLRSIAEGLLEITY
jgi:transcriptional regulator with XRE-family HTH domain